MTDLRRRGVRLWVEGDQLHYRAPKGVLTAEERGELRARKPEVIALCRDARSAGVAPPVTAVPRPAGCLPLSPAQQRLWFLHNLDGPNAAYTIAKAFRLRGTLDREAFQRALDALVARHETLRTVFRHDDGGDAQVILPALALPVPLVDLRALPLEARAAEVRRLVLEDVEHRFDLRQAPLVRCRFARLAEDEHVLLVCVHHVVADGWSLGLLLRELGALYEAFAHGRPSPLAPPALQYADFALWQRRWLTSDALAVDLDYWRARLAGAPPVLELPADRPRPAVKSHRGGVVPVRIPPAVVAGLRSVCRRADATLFMGVLAAFTAVLARTSGRDDVVVGTQTAGRTRPELESLVGFFVNTVALRIALDGRPSFADLVRRVRQTALEAFAHAEAPFEKVVEALRPDRDLAHTPIAQVMLLWQNAPLGELALVGVGVEPLETPRPTAKFDLTLEIGEAGAAIEGVLEYDADLFDAATIERLAGHLLVALGAAVADPGTPVDRLPMLTAAETATLARWEVGPPLETRWPHRALSAALAECAARYPERRAVVGHDRALTFREIAERAAPLARRLHALGATTDARVAVCCEPSPELIVAIVAVLQAGAAYLPLDPATPEERLALLLEEAACTIVVTPPSLARRLGALGVTPVVVDAADRTRDDATDATHGDAADDTGGGESPSLVEHPSQLAYVIYTSGSTGRPKGAMVARGAVLDLIAALDALVYAPLARARGERALQLALVASAAFDASVQQIFGALLLGHTLHVVDAETRRDGERLRRFLAERAIDVVDSTPTLLAMMAAGDPPELAPCHVLVGGEPLPSDLATELAERQITLTNVYGPTECTVETVALGMMAARPPGERAVPLGRPMPGMRVAILDPAGQRVPVGVAGELCIAGAAVGRGYLGKPGLTAERFVADPDGAGTRLYRTGDLAAWDAHGEIRFLGRNDDQVKVRGHRVELGEVESALRRLPGVTAAAVVLAGGDLVAYLVLDGGARSADELRRDLAHALPAYMIPARFHVLDALPLTVSGKVDRRRLPAPDTLAAVGTGTPYEPPRTDRERALAAVWEDVLQRRPIGIRDSYFALGGDSIKALQVAARLRERGLALDLRMLFTHPTVEDLALHLGDVEAERPRAPVVTDGVVPLTAIQARFFATFEGALHHFNQAIVLAARHRLAPPVLQQALDAVYAHHPALGLRYHRGDDGGVVQEAHARAAPPVLAVVDTGDAAALTADAARRQASFDLAAGPLVAAALYRMPDGDRLLLAAHHLVIDAVSWRVLVEDLETAYRALAAGAPAVLPPPTDSFARWATEVAAFARTPPLRAELDYWREVEARWPAALPLDGDGPRGPLGERGRASFTLSRELTAALLGPAHRAYGTDAQDLLLTALARALARWSRGQRVGLFVEGHGRERLESPLDLSRTVGWFTSMYPVVLDLGASGAPGDDVKRVKEALRGVPRRGLGYGILRHVSDAGKALALAPAVRFNYLGHVDDAGAGLFAPSGIDPGPLADPRARADVDLEITAITLGGRLSVSIDHEPARVLPRTAAWLADAVHEEAAAVIAHAAGKRERELTPSDIDYRGFDIAQLDRFLEQLS